MELKYSKKEKVVGIFIIFICVLLLSTIIILGRGKNWFQDYNTYYTIFDESYNLKVGADVKLFKTNIGKVKAISVENKVKIKLAILEKYESRIRTNTMTTVESPTFVGSEYISIIPGSSDAPLLAQEGEIPSKAKKSIAAGDGTVGNLLTSTQLLDAILIRIESVGEILTYLSEASSKTPDTVDQVQSSLTDVKEITDGVTQSVALLKNILTEFEKNMPNIQSILENAEKGSRDVPEITTSVTRVIQEARDEIENVDKVIQSLQNNFLIKPNLPPEPIGENTDAGLRR